MAKRNYLELYGKEESKQAIKARQAGGPAPAPQAAPAPEQGGADPQQMLMAFGQAMEAGDQQAAAQIAMEFTAFVYQQMAQEQSAVAATPAARKGGVAPKFDEKGNLVK